MKFRKRFGRWGEAAVARAFRDRGYAVATQEGFNRIPGRDLIVSRAAISCDIQVKATARRWPDDAYQIDWGKLKDYVVIAKERDTRFALAVANVRKRAIYLFTDKLIIATVERAERGIGDHYSRPGRLELCYAEAGRTWDLTVGEIAEGLRIAEAEGAESDGYGDDLFDGV
jgi:hypothetical protein